MSDLSPILLVLLLIVSMVAYVLFRRTSNLETQLRAEKQKLQEKGTDAEKARSQNRERATELEQLRKQLQDTKTKLKRLQKEQNASKRGTKATDEDEPSALAPTAASTVRVTDQALQKEHNQTVSALKKELASANLRVADLEAAEARRKAQAQDAVKALEAAANDKPPTNGGVAAPSAATPEDRLAAVETQLEAFKRAAGQQEKKLRRELKKADARANAANRRANSSHSLYLVIKAQLDLTSDRLALLKRKYEGAMPPEALRPEKPAAAESPEAGSGPQEEALQDAAAAVAEAEAEAAKAEAQARAEEAAAGVESPPAPVAEEDEVASSAEAAAESSDADPKPEVAAAAADAAQEPEKSRAEPQG